MAHLRRWASPFVTAACTSPPHSLRISRALHLDRVLRRRAMHARSEVAATDLAARLPAGFWLALAAGLVLRAWYFSDLVAAALVRLPARRCADLRPHRARHPAGRVPGRVLPAAALPALSRRRLPSLRPQRRRGRLDPVRPRSCGAGAGVPPRGALVRPAGGARRGLDRRLLSAAHLFRGRDARRHALHLPVPRRDLASSGRRSRRVLRRGCFSRVCSTAPRRSPGRTSCSRCRSSQPAPRSPSGSGGSGSPRWVRPARWVLRSRLPRRRSTTGAPRAPSSRWRPTAA